MSSKLAENTNTAWGGSLKTRDKPLIHGVLLLWKSPGGSCISSAFSKPLPSSGSAVSCCNVSVMVAFRKETHVHANESQADLSNASSFRSARARANHFFCLFVCFRGEAKEGRDGQVFTGATLFQGFSSVTNPHVLQQPLRRAQIFLSPPTFQCYCQKQSNCHRDPISQ